MTDSSDLSHELTAATPAPGSDSPSAQPPGPSAAIAGMTLGHFEVLELLGAGGFGEVYRARDTRLGRMVAIKVLPQSFAQDAERLERFRREAMAASALNHSNICTVHDLVEAGGHHLIVMELVEGKTLHAALANGPLPTAETLAIGLQIADALAEAHRAGILHRDIKGSNIVLTPRGQVKLLDFGLAKRVSPAGSRPDDPKSDTLTREGMALGTLSYMSPEQLLGNPVDQRSDLFSFGVVLYEMVTGRLPFRGSTAIATADAILHHEPTEFDVIPAPEKLKALIRRLLQKDPARRPSSAEEVQTELKALQAAETPGGPARFSRTALIAISVAGLLALGLASWLSYRAARVRTVREKLIPEVTRLVAEEEFTKAAAIGRDARRVLPGDPVLEKLFRGATIGLSITTEPAGAQISYRLLGAGATRVWEPLGRTPLTKIRVAKAFYLFRAEAPGHLPAYRIWPNWTFRFAEGNELTFRLDREGLIPSEMVRIPGGKVDLSIPGLDHLPEVQLDDYLMDRYEVTNAEYKRFVDAGGYQKRELWKQPFVKDGRTLSWEESLASFRDATGRPGPAAWELGNFQKGHERHPVAGVSWYEAAAYAEFAGKSLPSVYHWNRAARTSTSMLVVPASNFSGSGSVPVGGDGAANEYGTYDMAGNVKEWCWNESREHRRFILGGGFGEPTYMFIDQDAQSSWDRKPNFGFRCVKLASKPPDVSLATIEVPIRDYSKEKPASDDSFRAYKGLYAYDRRDLNGRVDATETVDDWTMETVSFDAAYGNERVIAYLYLPRSARPPYQTVIYFPGSNAIHEDKHTLSSYADFLPTSGRALLVPVYKGTYQRRDDLKSDYPEPTAFWRDHVIAWSKDLGRSIDYLETRKDIDREKLAYFGFSWGGAVAPVMLAVEDRFKAAILGSGGLEFQRSLPEVDQFDFVSRVRIPVLMLNGRYDHFFPVESSQLPLFRLLRTPEKDKKHVIYETGHAPPRKEFIRESLDWLDRYLGAVTR